ncbi:flagellar biosynthesis protein FlaG [Motiliproteus coralliicola]|uniref:Flagellar biosynthesis protein FlaG n=1 Tax=Motiliproteus coralliicola TaxID=2283196 RepID=A0A369WMV6_9GAMM|nr:flagellar protein FlaG [Motiliproteus coralliicola]RDE22399.1 flagellar biosynthesis protein FlaG [Motiliproteus coralliicola]
MSSEISISSTSLSPSSRSTSVSSPEAQAQTAAVDKATNVEAQQRRVEQAQESQKARTENMERLVEEINAFASQISRNLNFSVDDPTGHTVITVTEKESGELVRKIPSEEFLALSQHIQDMNNLLFKDKA